MEGKRIIAWMESEGDFGIYLYVPVTPPTPSHWGLGFCKALDERNLFLSGFDTFTGCDSWVTGWLWTTTTNIFFWMWMDFVFFPHWEFLWWPSKEVLFLPQCKRVESNNWAIQIKLAGGWNQEPWLSLSCTCSKSARLQMIVYFSVGCQWNLKGAELFLLIYSLVIYIFCI